MAGHFAPYCPVQFLGSISALYLLEKLNKKIFVYTSRYSRGKFLYLLKPEAHLKWLQFILNWSNIVCTQDNKDFK